MPLINLSNINNFFPWNCFREFWESNPWLLSENQMIYLCDMYTPKLHYIYVKTLMNISNTTKAQKQHQLQLLWNNIWIKKFHVLPLEAFLASIGAEQTKLVKKLKMTKIRNIFFELFHELGQPGSRSRDILIIGIRPSRRVGRKTMRPPKPIMEQFQL